jgi:glucose-1-phosphate adenylyltransferase
MLNTLFIIMAGGRGERLMPLTEKRPKPLVRFGSSGRIIDYTLANCLRSGNGDVILLTQYKSEMLEKYVLDYWGEAFSNLYRDISVMTSSNTEKGVFSGTADAVWQAIQGKNNIPDNIVVLAGDHIYRMDYREMIIYHLKHGLAATVGSAVCKRQDAGKFGIIESEPDGLIKNFHEKPKSLNGITPPRVDPLASMGIYVFSTRELLSYLEKSQKGGELDFGKHVLPKMAKSQDVMAYSFLNHDGSASYWRDVGDIQSYWQAHMELIDGKWKELCFDPIPGLDRNPLSINHFSTNLAKGPRKITNSLVNDNSSIGYAYIEDSIIGRNVLIEDGAYVKRSVILDGAIIKKGTYVEGAVVEENTEVSIAPAGINDDFTQKLLKLASSGLHMIQNQGKHEKRNYLSKPHMPAEKVRTA